MARKYQSHHSAPELKLHSVPSFCSSQKNPVIAAAKLPQDPPGSWGLNFHSLPKEVVLTPWSSEPLCTWLDKGAMPGIKFLIPAWHCAVPCCPVSLRQHSFGDAAGWRSAHAQSYSCFPGQLCYFILEKMSLNAVLVVTSWPCIC